MKVIFLFNGLNIAKAKFKSWDTFLNLFFFICFPELF